MSRRRQPANCCQTATPAAAGAVLHPGFAGVANYTTWSRPDDDDDATEQTINLMRTLAAADSQAPQIQAAAELATHGRQSAEAKAAGIFQWIKGRVAFKEDAETAAPLVAAGLVESDTELLIRPLDLIGMREPAGDCDDFSTLTAALLMAAGIPAEFVTIAADAEQPDNYSHVYTRALTPAGPIALDTSHGPYIGWEAAPVGKSRTWTVNPMNQTTNAPQLGEVPSWATDLFKIGAEAGAKIATTRYGQPPAGTYQQGADGSVLYRQQPGASALSFPGVGVGGSNGGTFWLIVGAGVLGLLFLSMSRSSR